MRQFHNRSCRALIPAPFRPSRRGRAHDSVGQRRIAIDGRHDGEAAIRFAPADEHRQTVLVGRNVLGRDGEGRAQFPAGFMDRIGSRRPLLLLRQPLVTDQRFQPARIGLQIRAERAAFHSGRHRMVQGRRIFGKARLVMVRAEDQLDDGRHRRARLRLDARILQQFGIIFGTAAGDQREIVGEADGAIKRAAAAAFLNMRFAGIITGQRQPVGERRVGIRLGQDQLTILFDWRQGLGQGGERPIGPDRGRSGLCRGAAQGDRRFPSS